MKTITITVPKEKNGKWSIFWGTGSPRLRKSASIILNALQRSLSRSRLIEKTSITVKMTDGTNTTYFSEKVSYLIWTCKCFLEDYLSIEVKNKIDRLYPGVKERQP